MYAEHFQLLENDCDCQWWKNSFNILPKLMYKLASNVIKGDLYVFVFSRH